MECELLNGVCHCECLLDDWRNLIPKATTRHKYIILGYCGGKLRGHVNITNYHQQYIKRQ